MLLKAEIWWCLKLSCRRPVQFSKSDMESKRLFTWEALNLNAKETQSQKKNKEEALGPKLSYCYPRFHFQSIPSVFGGTRYVAKDLNCRPICFDEYVSSTTCYYSRAGGLRVRHNSLSSNETSTGTHVMISIVMWATLVLPRHTCTCMHAFVCLCIWDVKGDPASTWKHYLFLGYGLKQQEDANCDP